MSETTTELTITSPTLLSLGQSVETVCVGCPNSMWFGSEKAMKCFCRVMHVVTWSDEENVNISACDGLFIGGEE